MSMLKKLCSYISDPVFRFSVDASRGKYNNLSDEEFLKRKYKLIFNRELDLHNPKTYNEKLQWIKLYDRKPIYTTMVDKYESKIYVSDIIGTEFIIPTLGVWKSFDDICFDCLPDKFVLKCTHDSGGLVICTDKSKFDYVRAKNKIEKSLKRNFFYSGREWPYKNVEPRIIAEEYKEDSVTKELRDYKFYTFNGKVRYVMVNSGRSEHKTKADYFDRDFVRLPFAWGYPNSEQSIEAPKSFSQMIEFAELLSFNTYELRVDFYECNGHVYFGELTFFDGGGFSKFNPDTWDYIFGSQIELPV